jgi:hypothetical protein
MDLAMESKAQPSALHAKGSRLHWEDMPADTRRLIEDRLGVAVLGAVTQDGGFSPGLAARLSLASGDRVFIKAVHPSRNADSPAMHRREAAISAELPASVPAPHFRWQLDEGPHGWIILAFDDIEGVPPAQPWREDELMRVLGAMEQLVEALTPSPIVTESAPQAFRTSFCSWAQVTDGAALDPWIRRNLDQLVELDLQAPDAAAGDTLQHMDVRADNLLLASDSVYFVDWPHARIGAPWIDIVGFAPSVAMHGGPQPQDLLALYSPALSADPAQLTAVIGALAGFFMHRSTLPEPEALPGIRAFQRAQGDICIAWLRERTEWD